MRRFGAARKAAAVAAALSFAVPLSSLTGASASSPQGSPQTLAVSLSGTNGVGNIQAPGLDCGDGGSGSYRHMQFTAPLPVGVLSNITPTGNIRGTLDIQHDGQEPPVGPVVGGAYLQGTQSHVTLSNYRGAVQVLLAGSTCTTTTPASPTFPLTFSPDGHTVVAGSATNPITGTFAINTDPGATNGAYRSATGGGTFKLTAGVAPGADNAWTLSLSGQISILEPSLKAVVTSVYWGNLGIDYATRIVSVTYTITNAGPGDAFNTSLVSTSSPTLGVTPLGPQPQPLGDLLSGESAQVTVRYQFGLLNPCQLVILNCKFSSVVNVSMPDALDVPGTFSKTLPVTAPNLPPPLS